MKVKKERRDMLISSGLFGMNHFTSFWNQFKNIQKLDAGLNVGMEFNDIYFQWFLFFLLIMTNSKFILI
jgi:hypothetical protein